MVTFGYGHVRLGVFPSRCCTNTMRSSSVKWPRCLKNSHAKVKFFVILKLLAWLNLASVSGLMRPPVECFSKNSFHNSKVSFGDVMILTSFLRSDIPRTVPPSFSRLILWNQLTISVLKVYNTMKIGIRVEHKNKFVIFLP
jgi:hypothetical protein